MDQLNPPPPPASPFPEGEAPPPQPLRHVNVQYGRSTSATAGERPDDANNPLASGLPPAPPSTSVLR